MAGLHRKLRRLGAAVTLQEAILAEAAAVQPTLVVVGVVILEVPLEAVAGQPTRETIADEHLTRMVAFLEGAAGHKGLSGTIQEECTIRMLFMWVQATMVLAYMVATITRMDAINALTGAKTITTAMEAAVEVEAHSHGGG